MNNTLSGMLRLVRYYNNIFDIISLVDRTMYVTVSIMKSRHVTMEAKTNNLNKVTLS